MIGVRRSGKTPLLSQCRADRLSSREVATSLRGRAMEVLVHPFSFREALRHAGAEPTAGWDRLEPAERTALDHRLRRYLVEGGFPEAQGAEARDRGALLAGYVDIVVLRDVIERHGVTNPLALRWLQRQLRARPFLITLDGAPPTRPLPRGLTWAGAFRWLLEEM